jgi:hypothetical protein
MVCVWVCVVHWRVSCLGVCVCVCVHVQVSGHFLAAMQCIDALFVDRMSDSAWYN